MSNEANEHEWQASCTFQNISNSCFGDLRFVHANGCASPQSDTFLTNHQNAAQRVLDGMSYMIQSVSEYSAGPTKAVAAWLTDQVAPPYWRPNNEITVSGAGSGPHRSTERRRTAIKDTCSCDTALKQK